MPPVLPAVDGREDAHVERSHIRGPRFGWMETDRLHEGAIEAVADRAPGVTRIFALEEPAASLCGRGQNTRCAGMNGQKGEIGVGRPNAATGPRCATIATREDAALRAGIDDLRIVRI